MLLQFQDNDNIFHDYIYINHQRRVEHLQQNRSDFLYNISNKSHTNFLSLHHIFLLLDFFDFHMFGYHWPAFNVADSAITIGVAMLLYDSFRPSKGTGDPDSSDHRSGDV